MANQYQHDSQTQDKITYPTNYNVVMHNDDVTTMDFVVRVLRTVFYKSMETATKLMLDVHHEGKAIVGTYSLDIAASKANKALLMAREEGFPFKLTLEPAEDKLPF